MTPALKTFSERSMTCVHLALPFAAPNSTQSPTNVPTDSGRSTH
jgi:hypothetical protein